MLYEANALAQLHVFDELKENWSTEKRTLHSNGISKKGRSFITYNIVKDDGVCFITGLRGITAKVNQGNTGSSKCKREDARSLDG